MRKQHSGHVINTSSIVGYQAAAGVGVYSSTKFAVEGITEALHAELKPLRIHATMGRKPKSGRRFPRPPTS